jgi:hypothetical protein
MTVLLVVTASATPIDTKAATASALTTIPDRFTIVPRMGPPRGRATQQVLARNLAVPPRPRKHFVKSEISARSDPVRRRTLRRENRAIVAYLGGRTSRPVGRAVLVPTCARYCRRSGLGCAHVHGSGVTPMSPPKRA